MAAPKILFSTTSSLDGYNIDKYFGVVSAQFVIGTGLFADFFSGWTDLFGAHSRSYQRKLDQIDREALDRLRNKAITVGANAVIGLRVDHDEIAGAGKSMLMVTASGTAIRVSIRPQSVPAETSRDIGLVTAEDVQALLKKKQLIARTHAGELKFDDEVWGFITEQRVNELADAAFDAAFIALSRPDASQDEKGDARNHVTAFFLALSEDAAKTTLYQIVARGGNRAGLAREIITACRLFDPERIAAALVGGSTLAKAELLQAVVADMPVYTPDDADRLGNLANAIDLAFREGPMTTTKKGMFGTREVWTCVCGETVNKEDEVCSSCRRNVHGFTDRMLRPESAGRLLRAKVEAIRELAYEQPG